MNVLTKHVFIYLFAYLLHPQFPLPTPFYGLANKCLSQHATVNSNLSAYQAV